MHIVSCVSQEMWHLNVIVIKKNFVLLLVSSLTVYNMHSFPTKTVAKTALKIEMHIAIHGNLCFSSSFGTD